MIGRTSCLTAAPKPAPTLPSTSGADAIFPSVPSRNALLAFTGGAVFCLGLLIGTGCRIEDRTPTGTRRDEDKVHQILGQYARRLSERDWLGVRSLFWPDGSYSGPLGPGAPADYHQAIPIDSALQILDRRLSGVERENFDFRVLRTDFRQQGDLAAAWLVTRRRIPAGSTAVERDWFEHVVLRQIDGDWRILSVAVVSSPRGGAR